MTKLGRSPLRLTPDAGLPPRRDRRRLARLGFRLLPRPKMAGGLHNIETGGLDPIAFQSRTRVLDDVYDPVNAVVGSLDELGAGLATMPDSGGIQDGGTLTVNSVSLGSYHYRVIVGNHTVSSFSSNDYFNTTADSRAAVLVVVGNLTINSGQTMIPSARKLFLFIYVTGTLTVSGSISMTARGANHSASGSNISAGAIRIINGTHGGVSDPQVPATGGAGAAGKSSNGVGNTGTAGTAGGSGGGGSGARTSSGASGAGATGTSFAGGPGSGAKVSGTGVAGGASGGAGGPASTGGSNSGGGGAGNPGGAGWGASGNTGVDGVGGTVAIICNALSGSGTITAAGSAGGAASSQMGGGGSGGGSVTVVYGSDSSSITPTAAGGAGGAGAFDGGAGGAGTARKLARA